MPGINHAKGKLCYWNGVSDPLKLFNQEKQKEITLVLHKLLSGESKSADLELKRSKKYRLYSVRLNQADRLLFTTIKIDGSMQLLLLDLILNHDYQKSWALKPAALKTFLDEEIQKEQLQPIEDLLFTDLEALPEKEKPSAYANYENIPVYRFDNRFIQLTEEQSLSLSGHFPLLIRGKAGSGKSFIGRTLLEQQLQYLANEQASSIALVENKIHLLFVSKSPRLIRVFHQEWLQSPLATKYEAVKVSFMDYETLAQTVDLSFSQKNSADYQDFEAWIKANKNTPWFRKTLFSESPIPLSILYNECKLIAFYQQSGQKSYLDLGLRESRLSGQKQKQEALLALYKQYQEYLKQNNAIDSAFYSLNSREKFDCVIVDESQDLSRLQIFSLQQLTKNNRICLCMDTNQALSDGLSDLDFLKQLFANTPLFQINLQKSHRTPPAIAAFSNDILKIKNYLCAGVLHEGEYCSQESIALNGGCVEFFGFNELNQLSSLTASAHTAVIIPHQTLLAEAEQLFNTPLIFTAEEIKGLEYPNIIAYKLFDGPEFKTINQALLKFENLNEIKLKENRPKQKENLFEHEPEAILLNQSFVALTRASERLVIVSENNANNHHLLSLLAPKKVQIFSKPSTAFKDKEEQKVLWDLEYQRLQARGFKDQAARLFSQKLMNSSSPSPCPANTQKQSSPLQSKQSLVQIKTTPILPNKEKNPTVINAVENKYQSYIKNFLLMPQNLKDNLAILSKHRNFVTIMFETKYANQSLFEHMIKEESLRHGLLAWAIEKDKKNESLSIFYNLLDFAKKLEKEWREEKLKHDLGLLFLCSINPIVSEVECICLVAELNNPQSKGYKWFNIVKDKVFPQTADSLYLKFAEEAASRNVFFLDFIIRELNTEIMYTPRKKDNLSLFYLLCTYRQKHSMLEKILTVKPEIIVDMQFEDLFIQNPKDGRSALLWLTNSLVGCNLIEKIFALHPEWFNKIKNELWIRNTEDNTSPFYWLSASDEGCNILMNCINKNSNLLFMPFDCLYAKDIKDGSSAFYFLSSRQPGRLLLSRLFTAYPALLKNLPIDSLYSVNALELHTAFYWLSGGQQGCTILLEIFSAHSNLIETLSTKILYTPYSNAYDCILYLLSGFEAGRDLLELIFSSKPDLLRSISAETLCSQDENQISIFQLFASFEQGRSYLEQLFKQNKKMLNSIHLADLCIRSKTQNISLLYWLSSCNKGYLLLEQLFNANKNWYTDLTKKDLFSKNNLDETSPFVLLCMEEQGCLFLEKIFTHNPKLLLAIDIDILCHPFSTDSSSAFFHLGRYVSGGNILNMLFESNKALLHQLRMDHLLALKNPHSKFNLLGWLAIHQGIPVLFTLFKENNHLLTALKAEHLYSKSSDDNYSLLFFLCYRQEGHSLLNTLFSNNNHLALCLSLDHFFEKQINAPTLFYCLATSESGIAVLECLFTANPTLFLSLSLKQLCASGEFGNSSSLFWIAAQLKGQAFLKKIMDHRKDFFAELSIEDLTIENQNDNSSHLHWLAASAEGRALLKTLFSPHSALTKALRIDALCNLHRADNSTPLYWLSASDEGCLLLQQIFASNEKLALSLQAENLLTINQNSDCSPLYLLSRSEQGIAFLQQLFRANKDLFSNFSGEDFFVQNKNNNDTTFYWLTALAAGHPFLSQLLSHNKNLAALLSYDKLAKTLESEEEPSFIYWLSSTQDGQNLMKDLFKSNQALLTFIPSHLWYQRNKELNTSAFFWLAGTKTGLLILSHLIAANKNFLETFPRESFFAKHLNDEVSSLYWLVEIDKKHLILNHFLKAHKDWWSSMKAEDLYTKSKNHNTSAFFWLSTSKKGCGLIKRLAKINPNLIADLDAANFYARSKQGETSPYYWLSASNKGRSLLEYCFRKNKNLVQAMKREDLCWINKNDQLSAFFWLTRTQQGIRILEHLFAENPKLRNLKPEDFFSGGAKNSKHSVFYQLVLTTAGRNILGQFKLLLRNSLQTQSIGADQQNHGILHDYIRWFFEEEDETLSLSCLNQDEEAQKKRLFFAIAADLKNTVQILIEANKAKYINTIYESKSPLYAASLHGNIALVKYFLNQGANPNQLCYESVSPLFIAAQEGHEKIVALLLNYQANPNLSFKTTEKELQVFRRDERNHKVKNRLSDYLAQQKISNKAFPNLSLYPYEIAKLMGYSQIEEKLHLEQKKAMNPTFPFFFSKPSSSHEEMQQSLSP